MVKLHSLVGLFVAVCIAHGAPIAQQNITDTVADATEGVIVSTTTTEIAGPTVEVFISGNETFTSTLTSQAAGFYNSSYDNASSSLGAMNVVVETTSEPYLGIEVPATTKEIPPVAVSTVVTTQLNEVTQLATIKVTPTTELRKGQSTEAPHYVVVTTTITEINVVTNVVVVGTTVTTVPDKGDSTHATTTIAANSQNNSNTSKNNANENNDNKAGTNHSTSGNDNNSKTNGGTSDNDNNSSPNNDNNENDNSTGKNTSQNSNTKNNKATVNAVSATAKHPAAANDDEKTTITFTTAPTTSNLKTITKKSKTTSSPIESQSVLFSNASFTSASPLTPHSLTSLPSSTLDTTSILSSESHASTKSSYVSSSSTNAVSSQLSEQLSSPQHSSSTFTSLTFSTFSFQTSSSSSVSVEKSSTTSSAETPLTTSSTSFSSVTSSGVGYLTAVPDVLVYSPYNNDDSCKTSDEVYSDLSLIKSKGVSKIRVYGTDCNSVNTVEPAAAKLGITINQGLWISSAGVDSINDGIADLIAYGSANGWDVFDFITVGNEAVLSGYVTVDELINKIASVKSQLEAAGYTGQITTSEPPVTFETYPQLCTDSEIDFVGINAHSYFDIYSSAQTSGTFVKGQVALVEQVCNSKSVFVTETGYPSAGIQNGGNIPSPENQLIAVQAILNEMDSDVTILTTFNDLWKTPGPYGIEQSFGIIQLLPTLE